MNLRRALITAATGAIILAGAGCNETANASSLPSPSSPSPSSPIGAHAASPDGSGSGKVGLSKALGDLDYKTLDEYDAHVDDMDECQRTVVFSRVALREPLDAITSDAGSEAKVAQVQQHITAYAADHADQFPSVFNEAAPTIYEQDADSAKGAALTDWLKSNCADLLAEMQANAGR